MARINTSKDEYLTIGQLAKRFALSRSTLLYYERVGLLRPASRSMGNYRLYGPENADVLQQIKLYRSMGVPVKKIGKIIQQLKARSPGESVRILRNHLEHITEQIEQLRRQQGDIVRLLDQLQTTKKTRKRRSSVRARLDACDSVSLTKQEMNMIKKDRWVEIMAAAGMSDEDMRNWHKQFEKLEPDAHQEFLESLDIQADEIASIREWSRQ